MNKYQLEVGDRVELNQALKVVRRTRGGLIRGEVGRKEISIPEYMLKRSVSVSGQNLPVENNHRQED